MVFNVKIADPLQRTKEYFDQLATERPPNFYATSLLPHIKLLSAEQTSRSTAVVTWSFHAHESFSNLMGALHGGCAATLLDFLTSVSLGPIAAEGFWELAGVSRTLNLTWLKPVPTGMDTIVYCEVLSVGKRLSVIRGEIRSVDGDKLITCEHGKVAVGAPKA